MKMLWLEEKEKKYKTEKENFGMNETVDFPGNQADYTGVYAVTKNQGLLACHNGLNDSAFPGKYAKQTHWKLISSWANIISLIL